MGEELGAWRSVRCVWEMKGDGQEALRHKKGRREERMKKGDK